MIQIPKNQLVFSLDNNASLLCSACALSIHVILFCRRLETTCDLTNCPVKETKIKFIDQHMLPDINAESIFAFDFILFVLLFLRAGVGLTTTGGI